MSKIKVSHEVPISYLEQSRKFNDYDYALVHLLEENEEYRNYFLESKEMGREIYLDNSLHELGTAIGGKILHKWIDKLNPTLVFVPDVWENRNLSLRNAKEWSKIQVPEGTEKVAIVQGKNIHDALLCTVGYKDLGYKKIAFSYGAGYYNEMCPHPNRNLGKAMGRLEVILTLYELGYLTKNDRVHLLGCAVPQEFGWYQGIECIESLDTSNPIMAAIEGTVYTCNGLIEKPKTNMNSAQDLVLSTKQKFDLHTNVSKFREINNL